MFDTVGHISIQLRFFWAPANLLFKFLNAKYPFFRQIWRAVFRNPIFWFSLGYSCDYIHVAVRTLIILDDDEDKKRKFDV